MSRSAPNPDISTGHIRLLDVETGETAYHRRLMFRDVSAETILYGGIKRFVVELELWLETPLKRAKLSVAATVSWRRTILMRKPPASPGPCKDALRPPPEGVD
ncbi:MAG: hypothetical protein O7E50_06315 [Gemmatimonadetes bacterium]|nr:hypothetical protein [Gemmatimonadota bacterium]